MFAVLPVPCSRASAAVCISLSHVPTPTPANPFCLPHATRSGNPHAYRPHRSSGTRLRSIKEPNKFCSALIVTLHACPSSLLTRCTTVCRRSRKSERASKKPSTKSLFNPRSQSIHKALHVQSAPTSASPTAVRSGNFLLFISSLVRQMPPEPDCCRGGGIAETVTRNSSHPRLCSRAGHPVLPCNLSHTRSAATYN